MSYLARPEAATIWAKRAVFLAQQGRAGERLPGCDHPRDRHGAREGQDLPLRHVRPPARRVRWHGGQGEWQILQNFLRNPNDIDGTASKLEAAATRAYAK